MITRAVNISKEIILILVLFGCLTGTCFAQSLIEDDPDVSASNRTPLILIHGWCGSQDDTWKHPGGFTEFFRSNTYLKTYYKLFYFNYSTHSDFLPFVCPAGVEDHSWSRVRTLAVDLSRELRTHPNVGPDTEIAIIAHSLEGLIARSFMQELQQHDRTRVLITLGTPHHGTLSADNLDGFEVLNYPETFTGNGELSGLYWD